MHNLDPKKEQLLKAVVKKYIYTASPVASLMLGGQDGLEASSATLRNWMGELENLGYLKQRHSSSGRIPTDRGYRHYVDILMDKENLSPKERRLIKKELEQGFSEIEDLVEQAAVILSSIGKCVAFVLPTIQHNFILKSLQLVWIDEEKVLLVLLTESGLVLDRVIEMKCSKERVQSLSNLLNEKLAGKALQQIGPHLLEGTADSLMEELFLRAISVIRETLEEENKNKLFIEGAHHLLNAPEFHDLDKFKMTLGALRKENRVSRFLGRIGEQATLNIVIGYENPLKDFQELSVIVAPYGIGSHFSGTLALAGPTRMDYDHLVPLIRYASFILSNRLQELMS